MRDLKRLFTMSLLKTIITPQSDNLLDRLLQQYKSAQNKTRNTFLHKRDVTPARTPYKTCEKGMVPQTMIFL